MRDFRDLKVWERSHHLTLAIYKRTASFPKQEQYVQLRRCSASIPANIAEGCGRSGNAELARFLRIAMGSASELEYHLLLAHDLTFLSTFGVPAAHTRRGRNQEDAHLLHSKADS